ncbi:MAG TPA: D-alanine--D-alanine ligase family protein [Candidatus Saccharimonadales bacterium]|nr:D-alanine--D-alanine ligase family protein [Candidatus Saccharimonadales bacterium]
MQRIRVLLLFGGESSEHEVSIASARNVYAAMDDRAYDITLGYISKDGHWHIVEDIEVLEGQHRSLLPVLGARHFVVEPGGHTIVPDVILPILHGTNGEDGTVQGLARLMRLPIVGCDVLSSAICMDKEVAKRLLRSAGIAVADDVVLRRGDAMPDFPHITLQLGNPVFVKPANQGSSVGVSKVYTEAQFAQAVEEAFVYDSKVLIEQGITGRELECSVLGNHAPEASGIGEVKSPEGNFYSYDAKYSPTSTTELFIPADISEEAAEKIRTIALASYRALECQGMARVDVFLTEEGTVYVNELNTLPGFTNISMYPKLWRQAGLSYSQLIDKLIRLALEDK